MKKTTEPTFVDLHRPRHKEMEAWSALMKSKSPQGLVEFAGTFAATTDTKKSRPSNLLDLYLGNDCRQLAVDLLARPDHYDERQHQLIAFLTAGGKLDRAITDAEKNELMMTLMRPTASDLALRERNRREAERRRKQEQEDDEYTLLEDGTSVADALGTEKAKRDAATFEKQDFGDRIIV